MSARALYDLPRLPPSGGGARAARACCCSVVGLACALSLLQGAALLHQRPPPTATPTAAANRTVPIVAPPRAPDALLRLERASRAWSRLGENASVERVLRQIDARWHEPGRPHSALTVDLARAVGWLARQSRPPR